MVRLEKIVIQGFKSFKRKTAIPFPFGFSVITGPNGSGKSNVGDAISFVLGKTSSKSLRAKKTQNLIFHGSTSKKSSPEARVTLYLNNEKKELPFEDKNVTISRRTNNKGVSTYRLNGRVVTRQQMVDVMIQAGISPEGHNIIQQGDVNQIVEMDPIQRRQIIDNISGISEYEEKKQKALKELGKIEERVREAEILLNEKTSTMEKLAKERDAALRYKQLEQDLNNTRSALLWKEYSESERGIGDVEEKLIEKTAESDKLETDIKDYDAKLSDMENKLEQLTKDVIHASDQIEVTKKITKLRSDMERIRDKLDSNEREAERIGEMIDRIRTFDKNINPAAKSVLGMEGVCGTLSDLITVPGKYSIAVDVAGGGHMQDIVVETTATAVKCVKYLKENKIGRARFLPLDKIRIPVKHELPRGTLGWVSELIHHDQKFIPVVEFVFGRTAAINDIDKAKEIARNNRLRMVTLDGDLVEASGAITGGFYKKGKQGSDISKYLDERKRLEKETDTLQVQLREMNEKLEGLAGKEEKMATASFERERVKLDESLRKTRDQRKEAYERRLVLQQEIGKLNIQKARIEAKFDNLKVQLKEKPLKDEEVPEELKEYIELEIPELESRQKSVIKEIESLGPVNMKALEDFDALKEEFDEFREKVDKIVIEKESIENTLNIIEDKRKETFSKTLNDIAMHFREVYSELTYGEAALELEDPEDIETGLMIRAQPPGKKLLNIDSMSGGEKTLTAFTFLFAVQRHKPTPFYILDEADAALDKSNTKKVAELIRKQSALAQFITISHNDALVSEADQVYGVTMEDGESKIMGIKLPKGGEQPTQTDEDFSDDDIPENN